MCMLFAYIEQYQIKQVGRHSLPIKLIGKHSCIPQPVLLAKRMQILEVGCFAFLWFVAYVLSVMVVCFPLDVIVRLCSEMSLVTYVLRYHW